MVSFTSRKISTYQTSGEKLEWSRESLNISLKQVELATQIPRKFLEALEQGDYTKLPGQVYAKNFIKTYANFLSLETAPLLALFDREYRLWQKTNQSLFDKEKEKNSNLHFLQFYGFPKILRIIFITLVILGLSTYLGISIQNMFTPPYLTVKSPSHNLITKERLIRIEGQTEKEAKVIINGQEITPRSDGFFKTTLDLPDGINTIQISAQKKHGRERVIQRNVLVTEKN